MVTYDGVVFYPIVTDVQYILKPNPLPPLAKRIFSKPSNDSPPTFPLWLRRPAVPNLPESHRNQNNVESEQFNYYVRIQIKIKGVATKGKTCDTRNRAHFHRFERPTRCP